MSNKRKLNRSGAVLATGALLGASLVAGVTGTASAEEFDPANAAPTVSIDTSTLTMSPDSGVGDNIYTIAATVGDANSLLDLNTVTLCLYKVGAPNAGDASCATQDPQSTAKITWTRSIDEFDVDASSGTESSNWELGTGGDAEPSTNNASYSYSAYSASGTSMTMQYRFRVSDVATEGTDWAVRVVAADGDTTTTANDTTGFSVNWYGRVATQRSGYDWAEVTTGSSSTANALSAGTIVTNGGSDVQMSTSTFTDGTTSLANALGTTNTAVSTDREFAIDVDPGATYDGTGTSRLIGSLADVETGDLTSGTVEAGSTGSTQSFKLWLGNSVPRSGTPYTGTVTVGVTQD